MEPASAKKKKMPHDQCPFFTIKGTNSRTRKLVTPLQGRAVNLIFSRTFTLPYIMLVGTTPLAYLNYYYCACVNRVLCRVDYNIVTNENEKENSCKVEKLSSASPSSSATAVYNRSYKQQGKLYSSHLSLL